MEVENVQTNPHWSKRVTYRGRHVRKMTAWSRAMMAGLAALCLVATTALYFSWSGSAAAESGLNPLELAQAERDNCRVLLAHAVGSAQRNRALNCINDQTVVINAESPTPTPSATATPTPTPSPTVTSSPSSSPTVTPTPTPTPNPPPAGFPTPGDTASGSTGWRHTGVTLTVHTELMRITTPGAIVDSVEARGGIEVQANDVTIKRSWVQGQGTGPGAGIWIDNGRTGTTIVDVEVSSHPGYDPNNEFSIVDRAITAGSGKSTSGVRMTRIYAHDMIRGLQFSCGTIIEDSWIDNEVNPGGAHMSAIGGDTCSAFSLVVRHNHVGLSPNDDDSAALLYYPPQVGSYGNQHVDISITDNYIIGGTYCLWLSSDPQLDGAITVTGNRFGIDYYPLCGKYNATFTDVLPREHGPGPLTIIWSDNLMGDLIVVAPHA